MGKRAVKVGKKLKGCSIDYCYINEDDAVTYETAQLDYFDKDRARLMALVSRLTGKQGVKVLAVTEIVRCYEMPVTQFISSATMVDVYEGQTVQFED